MRLGLRWQIVLSLLVLMLVTVTLVASAVVGLTRRALERQAVASTERLAELAGTTMNSALETTIPLGDGYNAANLQRLCELFAAEPSGTRVRVIDRARSVVAAAPRDEAERVLEPALVEVLRTGESTATVSDLGAGRAVDAFAPIRLEGAVVGALHIHVPLVELPALVAESEQLVIRYFLLDALIVLVLGYWMLTRLIVLPLHEVARATERVAGGDLAARVDERGATELRRVAADFNRMVDRLRAGRDQLEARLAELADANAQLARANAEVARTERLATVGTLAAGVAHEIGNPLAAVVGLVDLIGDIEALDPEERADAVERVRRELRRIDGIIRELLDFARAGDEKPGLLDAAEPVEAALRLCDHRARGRAHAVELVVAPDLPAVRANGNRVVQMVLNLLLNAIDAAGPDGRVRVAVGRDGDDVTIEVVDDGPGIEPHVLGRIFDPFFTTKAPGVGTGLGLAVVERLAAEAGGSVEVESSPGAGATFRVRLPAVSAPGA
jgi:two-component system NtrC family sensor kinase